jgi:hypothetical protein
VVFANSIYILIKLISIISFTFFIRGFVVIGTLYKIDLLQIIAFIILICNFLFGIYDIFSLIFDQFIAYSIYARTVTFGILSILLGISLIKLHKKVRTLSLITGIFEILAGPFLVLFLIEIGIATIFPLQLLEIILLYVISNKIS